MYFKHTNSTIERNKKKKIRAFMQWPRLVKEHLKFYTENDTPKAFDMLLYEQLFKVMSKQIQTTNGYAARNALKKQLLQDISAIKVPFLIRFYLSILVLFPYSYVLKFYGYYLVPYIVKNMDK
jgi:uncharacterized membrane protein YheB (UPF0754 family)